MVPTASRLDSSARITRFAHRLVLTLCLLLLIPGAARAQTQQQERDLGFSANGVYSTTDVDSVNLFNGNVTIAIPIGQAYPVSERLSYQLTLVYNANSWSYVPIELDQFYVSGVPSRHRTRALAGG